MSKEKIIALAKQAGFVSFRKVKDLEHTFECCESELEAFANAAIADFLKSSGQYLTNDASRESCIKQAKSEAFEAAAKLCEKESVDPHNVPAAIVARRCADAIREMAKEKQNATD